MNRPVLEGLRLNVPAYVRHTRLDRMGGADRRAHRSQGRVHWCDGSEAEYQRLTEQLVAAGTLMKLNPELRPRSFLARSDATDVARVEDRTFICSAEAGRRRPHQQLEGACRDARAAADRRAGPLQGRHEAAARSTWCRFSMGPLGSHIAHIGVELTDSPYVAVSMRTMTRMGRGALDGAG